MSADNLIRIKKKENGLYRVTHESASSLIHALNGLEPTEEELTLEVIADDIDEKTAKKEAIKFEREIEENGGEVEYGIVSADWVK